MNGNNVESNHGFLPIDPNYGTTAIHAGYKPKDWDYAPVVPSISLSTTFEQDGPAQHKVSCLVVFSMRIHIEFFVSLVFWEMCDFN